LIALTSPGSYRIETTMCLLAAAQQAQQAGLGLGWQHFGGSLVDKARNDACRALLGQDAGFVLFVDGDMVFPADALMRLVHTAYVRVPHFDVVGGYCILRGNLAPSIDTGTGTWEKHFPGSGVLEVIRTGGAFLLVKRHVLEKMPAPWFALRHPMRWLDAMAEVDNFARTRCHGHNPFRELPIWDQLQQVASQDRQSASTAEPGYEVGEDSGFCDRVKAAGFRIGVDTDLEIAHIDTKLVAGASFKERMDEMETQSRRLYGVLV